MFVAPHDFHHECGMRMVIGSVGHQKRECSCYGKIDTTEDNLTTRQAAKAATEYYYQTHRSEV